MILKLFTGIHSLLMFIEFSKYLLFLHSFGWRLSGKKYPGSRKSRILIPGLSKSYIFGESHLASPYCLESFPEKGAVASSLGLL